MDQSFDTVAYVIHVGQTLVKSFEEAGFATTPGQIGSAREVSVRERLENLLPEGIAVGSGFVIDSFGASSKQMDVVLYEKHFCPVFCINGDPSTTYYPCEGVIAVGEIKSSITSDTLADSFGKLASAKVLRRFAEPSFSELSRRDVVPFRPYGSSQGMSGTKEEEFNQDMNPKDQIFGFILSGDFKLSSATLLSRFMTLVQEHGYDLSPNITVSMAGGVIVPMSDAANSPGPVVCNSLVEADSVYYVEHGDRSFQYLLSSLYKAYRAGRTVTLESLERYFTGPEGSRLSGGGRRIPLPKSISHFLQRSIGE